MSDFFVLSSGIRQGGVLSPYLFAVYIDSVIMKVVDSNVGCHIKLFCINILLYADDILLLAPSISALQQLIHVCQKELEWLDMTINVKKSVCLRIGARCKAQCNNIFTLDSCELQWANSIRYLGVHTLSAGVFTCSLDNAKRSFYRAFNSLFGKIGRVASEDVVVQLLKTKCLPVLYYCVEACPLKKSQLSAVDFAFNCTFRKIFSTRSQEVVDMCKQIFSCQTPSDAVANRKCKFLKKFIMLDNMLCQVFKDVAVDELILLASNAYY